MLSGERKIARARTDRRGRLLLERFSCRLASAGPHRVLWARTVPRSFAAREAEPSLCLRVRQRCVLPPGVGHNLPTGQSLTWGNWAWEAGDRHSVRGQRSRQLARGGCGPLMGIRARPGCTRNTHAQKWRGCLRKVRGTEIACEMPPVPPSRGVPAVEQSFLWWGEFDVSLRELEQRSKVFSQFH